jgi:integrase
MLSVTAINNAKPKDKPYKIADEKGMYLLIQSSGGKLWRFDYRFAGKRKTLALGSYPEVPLANARDKRDEARKLLASTPPIDPSEQRKKEKVTSKINANNSFESVAREWWQSHMANKAPSHREKVIRRFEIYLFPWIGKKPISEITAPQIMETVKRIEKQNKLDSAHRALQTAGQVFRYAVQTGRATRDVTADLHGALPARSVKHMAAFTEPKDVAALLNAIDAFKGTLTVECALKFSPLVFVRPGELRKAKWCNINLDAGEWRYLVSKTNTEHLVPLSTQAIEILKTIQLISGSGEYVFQNGHSPTRPMSEAAVNAALKRMGFDTQKEITGHGFRAMARTILHERLNIDPYVIEHQLAHKVPDALGAAYNRTMFLEQRKIMMQTWANYLDELKAGKKVEA